MDMAEKIQAIKSGIVPALPDIDKNTTLNLISSVDSLINSLDVKGLNSQYQGRLLENSTPLFLTATDFIFNLANGEQLSKKEGWLLAVANAIKHGYVTTNTVKKFGFSERACDAGVKKGFLTSLYEFIDLRPKIYILSMLYPIMDPYIIKILPNVKYNFIVKNQFISECNPTIHKFTLELTRERHFWNPFNKLLVMFMDRVIEGYDANVVPPPLIEDNFNFKAAVRDSLVSLMDIKKAWHSFESENISEEQLHEYMNINIGFIEDQCKLAIE